MKWLKERDDLIAQTKAFVQSVAGRPPALTAAAASVAENPAAYHVTDQTLPSNRALPSHGGLRNPAPASPSRENFGSAQPIERIASVDRLPPIKEPDQGDVRKEIQSRVAAFQAHQHRFHREREAYFNSVLAKARSSIENGPDTPAS